MGKLGDFNSCVAACGTLAGIDELFIVRSSLFVDRGSGLAARESKRATKGQRSGENLECRTRNVEFRSKRIGRGERGEKEKLATKARR